MHTDIDECELEMDACDQECNNTIGGYECFCQQGYMLENFSVCSGKKERESTFITSILLIFI